MQTVAEVLQETIEKARPVMGKGAYRGVVSSANSAIMKALSNQHTKMIKQYKKAVPYNKKIGEEICRKMESGKTLTAIAQEVGIELSTIYSWIDEESTGLGEAYNRSKRLMTRSMVDKLVIETETLKSEDALAARVKSDVVKWVASRLNPEEFADTRRIELKGEVNHRHTHELAPEQKRRIAESWLVSQEPDSVLPAITAETTGPDLPALEGVAVREIQEGEQGERVKRKRSTQPVRTSKRKPGRPRKLAIDDPIDRDDKRKPK